MKKASLEAKKKQRDILASVKNKAVSAHRVAATAKKVAVAAQREVDVSTDS